MRAKSFLLLSLSPALLFVSGCAMIAGGYRVPDGTSHDRNYSSVAGDIDIGRRAAVRNVDTVAGDIEIGDGTHVASVDSVAGDVRLGEHVTVDKSVETVAGDIEIGAGCTIGGSVESVAGDISIMNSVVKGDVIARAGDLETERSRIGGVLRVKHVKDKDADLHPPRITVGPGMEVTEIIVDERTTVRLKIHRSAKVGKVTGATAEYYD